MKEQLDKYFAGTLADTEKLTLFRQMEEDAALKDEMADMQNIMYKQGAYIAANLDGGSSTTLYYNGKVVNKPADLLGERMIPTSFIVK